MAWYSKLLPGQEARDSILTASQQQALAAWQRLPAADLRLAHHRSRYVVLDVEATGVNMKTDRLGSIGALSIDAGMIDFRRTFHAILASEERRDGADGAPLAALDWANSPDRGGQGLPPAEALTSFLSFVGKAPLVAYHASFAATMIERALAEYLGIELALPWIDLAWVMSDLFREISDDGQGRLDSWLAHFDVENIERHHAVSDAYATAKLLQITIARASRNGFTTPASLLELEKARRHMHQSR